MLQRRPASSLHSIIYNQRQFFMRRGTQKFYFRNRFDSLSLRHAWMVINWSWQSQCHYLTFFGHGVKYCDASKKVFHKALLSFLLWFSRFKTTPETVTGRNNWLKKWGRKEPQNKFFSVVKNHVLCLLRVHKHVMKCSKSFFPQHSCKPWIYEAKHTIL